MQERYTSNLVLMKALYLSLAHVFMCYTICIEGFSGVFTFMILLIVSFVLSPFLDTAVKVF